jgi:hypothetical protein
MAETRLDRVGRPLERWNARPTVAEMRELTDAQDAYRRATEAAIDDELRKLRAERLQAAELR